MQQVVDDQVTQGAPVFMLVAGELSGDLLGGGLIRALKQAYPEASFFGIGGPDMMKEGLESLEPLETLSIMGLVEVLKELPKLFRVKKRLVEAAKLRKPCCFIGIDAPDFNLRLAKDLKSLDITTFQYVSPSVWVWREGRVKGIRKVIDRVLCLFPFEVDFYRKHQVDAVCVGHRLGDEIPLVVNSAQAQQALGLMPENLDLKMRYVAVLPGSRRGEISRLLPIFLQAIESMSQRDPSLRFLIPAATPVIYEMIMSMIHAMPDSQQKRICVFQGESRNVMAASETVLLASGTAALEAMLLKKTMVVCYRFNAFTAWLAPKIVKISHFSLPNILAKSPLVTELFQQAVTPENIVNEMEKALADNEENRTKIAKFTALHQELRRNADSAAADAVISLLKQRKILPSPE